MLRQEVHVTMSANQYATMIKTANVSKADQTWFPKWVFRYASSQRTSRLQPLAVSEQDVIRFLRSLRDQSVPAWQRLQAARAVASYRNPGDIEQGSGDKPCTSATNSAFANHPVHQNTTQSGKPGESRFDK
jgi:hypothetical protein